MPENDQFSEAETERRREAALKRMLSTPPVRHTDSKKVRKTAAKSRLTKPKADEA